MSTDKRDTGEWNTDSWNTEAAESAAQRGWTERETARRRSSMLFVYAGLAIALSLFVGWVVGMRSLSALPFRGNIWVLPACVIAAISFRFPILLRLMPVGVFTLLTFPFAIYHPVISWPESLLLTIASLGIIATSSRLHDLLNPNLSRVITERVDFAPAKKLPLRESFSLSHGASLIFIVLAWIVAGLFLREFDFATSTIEIFKKYKTVISTKFGVLHWVYNSIKLIFLFAFLFAIANGLMSYLRARNNSGNMATLLLRRELWNFNRWEQRKIAKLLRKQT